ncbi:MAG: hypothetical protein Q9157_003995 [Trypethelium eluteriae]
MGPRGTSVWRHLLDSLCGQANHGKNERGDWDSEAVKRSGRRADAVGILFTPYPPEVSSLEHTEDFIIATRRFLIIGGALQTPRPLVTWPIQYKAHIRARYPGVAGRDEIYRVQNAMVYKIPQRRSSEQEAGRKEKEHTRKLGFVPPCYCAKCDGKQNMGISSTRDGLMLDGLRCISPLCPHSRVGPLMVTNLELMVFKSKRKLQRAIKLAEYDWRKQWELLPTDVRKHVRAPSPPRAALQYGDYGSSEVTKTDCRRASVGFGGRDYFEEQGVKLERPVVRRKPTACLKLVSGMPTPKESMPSDEPSQGTLDKAVGPLIQNQGKSSSPDRPSTSSPFLMNNKQHIRHSTTHVESQSVISHDATMNNVSSVSDPSAVLRNVEPTKGLVSPQNMSALPPPLPPKSPLRQSTLGSQSPEKRFSFPPPLPPKSPLRSQSVSPLPLESPYRSQAVPRLPPKSPLRSRPIPPTLVLMLPRKDQSSTTILYSPSIYSEISVRSRLPAKYPLHKDQSSTTILYSPSIYSEISVRPRLPTKYPSLDYCPTAVQACIRQHSTAAGAPIRRPVQEGQQLLPLSLQVGQLTRKPRRKESLKKSRDGDERMEEAVEHGGDGDGRFAHDATLRILEGGPGTRLRDGESQMRVHRILEDRERELWI